MEGVTYHNRGIGIFLRASGHPVILHMFVDGGERRQD